MKKFIHYINLQQGVVLQNIKCCADFSVSLWLDLYRKHHVVHAESKVSSNTFSDIPFLTKPLMNTNFNPNHSMLLSDN